MVGEISPSNNITVVSIKSSLPELARLTLPVCRAEHVAALIDQRG